ncbi:MAG: hypothetical protein Q4D13_06335 [Erysipelotrichaceae bacterium]|nr:hypothetical protein [Erysipelotrichaceae bacterium]
MKSKELKVYNIPINERFLDSIDAKPAGMLVLMMLIGMALIVLRWGMVFGISLIAFSSVCLLFMPQDVLMYFYNDFLILYNKANRENCVLIYYDEVASWYYSWGASADYLYIELVDGMVEKIEAFSKTLFEAKMRTYMKDKQKKVLK